MPEWVPDWFVDFLGGITALELVLWVVGAIAVLLFLRKAGPWFVVFAKAVINTAELIDSVKGLPDFIDRTDSTLTAQNVTLEQHSQTLATQDKRIAEIHHETHTNNGSSIKDAVVRTEEVLNTQVLPQLKVLAGEGAQLRHDFEDAQGPSEIHVTVKPKTTGVEQ